MPPLVSDPSQSTSQAEDALPAVSVDDVHFRYPAGRRRPPIVALDGVHLRIAPGERIAMLGPNGSGKSTLMHLISGTAQPDAGEVRVFGERGPDAIHRMIGVVFQHPSHDPHMSVWENLRDHALLQGIASRNVRSRVEEMLNEVGLTDRMHDRVRTLSGGLARRADLARALLHKPRLLLLDEPTVGLDPSARQQFLAQVESRWRRAGLTVLMSTHLVDEADQQDRVVLMHEGRIVADDSPAQLRASIGRRVLTVHDAQWQPDGEHPEWRPIAGGWRRSFDDDAAAVYEVLNQLAAANVPFSFAPPTLADVFEHYTGSRLHDGDESIAPNRVEHAS